MKREILDDPTGEDAGFDLGQAWLYLFNIAPTPPPDYRIGIEPAVPGKVACNTDFQVPVVPDRTMKVYACDFTVAVDEGITIKSAAPGAGFQVQTAPDGKSVRIWRTGAYPVAVRAVDEPLATLTLNAGGAAPAGMHRITVTDQDGRGVFDTTALTSMGWEQTGGEFLLAPSTGWQAR